MMDSPNILNSEAVGRLHELVLDRFGGMEGLRDLAALDSAVAEPANCNDPFDAAAAYAVNITRDQPFVDRNLETALAAALTFLDMNGVSISQPDGRLSEMMTVLADGQLNRSGVSDILRMIHDEQT